MRTFHIGGTARLESLRSTKLASKQIKYVELQT